MMKPCPVNYKHPILNKALAKTGDFHLEGNRIICEPQYNDPRKKQSRYYEDLIGKIIQNKGNIFNFNLT